MAPYQGGYGNGYGYGYGLVLLGKEINPLFYVLC
jgi:hypothetical protein